MVAYCVNQYVGYLPTREAFPRGGHEVESATWAKVTPDALETVVDGALGLLEKLFAQTTVKVRITKAHGPC